MTNNSTLVSISINTVRRYLVPQLLLIFFGLCNVLFCLVSSLTLWRGAKTLSGRVFVLLRIFFLNDFLGTCYACCVQFWHVYNNVQGYAEIFRRPECFWINGILFFFLSNNALVAMMVALDRLHCTLHSRTKVAKNFEPIFGEWITVLFGHVGQW